MKLSSNIKFLLTTLLFTGIISMSSAQQNNEEKETIKPIFEPNNALIISPYYMAQLPFADMGKRFGLSNQVGLTFMYKMKKNWMIGAEGGFIFGTKLRENYVLDKISNANGQFTGQTNDLITVRPNMLGGIFKVQIGKLIPFSKKYPDAGLLLITGIGFLQHKISINVRENILPQLDKTYRKGYDRMSNGPALSQFIGGIFMERRKMYSFYGGIQFDVGFTQNRRAFDFYEMKKLEDKRIDFMIGFKLGWILPIFLQASEKEYFYN